MSARTQLGVECDPDHEAEALQRLRERVAGHQTEPAPMPTNPLLYDSCSFTVVEVDGFAARRIFHPDAGRVTVERHRDGMILSDTVPGTGRPMVRLDVVEKLP